MASTPLLTCPFETPTCPSATMQRLFPAVLSLVMALWAACSAESHQASPDQDASPDACPSRRSGAPAPAMAPSLSSVSRSGSLRLAYMRARQEEAGSDHAFQPQRGASRRLRAHNPGQGLIASLDGEGLHLRGTHEGAAIQVSLRLTSQGCATSPRTAIPRAPQAVKAHRVEYADPEATEWYVNGPLGLEHGFTVHRDLHCSDGRMAFGMELDGDVEAALSGRGSEVSLVVRSKQPGHSSPLIYSGLFAVDFDGNELPSRLLLSGRTVRIEVEAAGAKYPVTIDPMWTQQAKLTGSDAAFKDAFGMAVAIDGDTAVIAAPQKTIGTNPFQGQVYVFVRSGAAWTEQSKLVASDGTAGDLFGSAVAISGDSLVVGAPMKSVGVHADQGQAYVFVRSGTSWSEQARLVGSDGAKSDRFGNSVALHGDTVVVGASGKKVGSNYQQGQAYVYTRAGSSWSEQAKLIDNDGNASEVFGYPVSISKDTIAIGAVFKTHPTSNLGQVFVYVRSGVSWSEQAKLIASDGAFDDGYGWSVSISEDTIFVGAYGQEVNMNARQGQVYVYTRSGVLWSEQAKLTASDGEADDSFGIQVALSGSVAVIGAPLKTVGANRRQGQAYVYVRTGAFWTEQAKLAASDGAIQDAFGFALAVSRDTVLAGLAGKAYHGQAYVFTGPTVASPGPNGVPCITGAQCESTLCVDGVCCDGACGGGSRLDCLSCVGALTGKSTGTCGVITQSSKYICRPSADTCDRPVLCDGKRESC